MAETDTAHLIKQAAYELELGDVKVEPSLDQPGFYSVTRDDGTVTAIPMDAEFKGILAALSGGK